MKDRAVVWRLVYLAGGVWAGGLGARMAGAGFTIVGGWFGAWRWVGVWCALLRVGVGPVLTSRCVFSSSVPEAGVHASCAAWLLGSPQVLCRGTLCARVGVWDREVSSRAARRCQLLNYDVQHCWMNHSSVALDLLTRKRIRQLRI